MKETLSSKSLGLGLFTFYMAQCVQPSNGINLSNASNTQQLYNPITNYGRKQMTNGNEKIKDTKYSDKKSKVQQYQQRQEKLHKFLINCVGAAKRNPHHNHTFKNETQRYSQPISALACRNQLNQINGATKTNQQEKRSKALHSIHVYTKTDDPLNYKEKQCQKNKKAQKKEIQKKSQKSSKDSKRSNSCTSNESKKVPIANIQLQNHSSYQSSHQNSRKQIKIKPLQLADEKNKLSIGSKKGKYDIKFNPLDNEQKNQNRHTIDELYDLKNGLKQLKLFNNIYPRLIKHNSQKVYAHQQQIQISSICKKQYAPNHFNFNKYKKVTDSPHHYVQIAKENYINQSKKITPTAEQRTKQKTVVQKSINLNQSLNGKRKTQIQPLPQIYPLIAAVKTSLCKNQNILIQFSKKKDKKSKRLQIILKNGKNNIIKAKNEQNLEEQNKINQIYYSIDNKQKKVPQINLGLAASNRLLDGWEQRKKQLLQKIKDSYNKNLKEKQLNEQNQRSYRLFKCQKETKNELPKTDEKILHIR